MSVWEIICGSLLADCWHIYYHCRYVTGKQTAWSFRFAGWWNERGEYIGQG